MNHLKYYLYHAVQYYVRNFPINKGKHRVVSQTTRLFPLNDKRITTLRFNDLEMECDLSQYIQKQLYFFGEYEKEESQLWVSRARNAATIFDIGANVGFYSLLAASANPNSIIHAFEPTPVLQQIIRNNIKINKLANIIINPVAVGKDSGETFLNICTGSDGTNEGMNFISHSKIKEVDEVVKVITIDDYCQNNNIKTIDLLKMDIEGGEYGALSGAQNMLENKAIQFIMMELVEWAANRSGSSCKEIKQLLLDSGYQIYKTCADERTRVGIDDKYEGNVIVVAQRE